MVRRSKRRSDEAVAPPQAKRRRRSEPAHAATTSSSMSEAEGVAGTAANGEAGAAAPESCTGAPSSSCSLRKEVRRRQLRPKCARRQSAPDELTYPPSTPALWLDLPEGPLHRVFELMASSEDGHIHVMRAGRVCKNWRVASQAILLGDTAASRPHRPLPIAKACSAPTTVSNMANIDMEGTGGLSESVQAPLKPADAGNSGSHSLSQEEGPSVSHGNGPAPSNGNRPAPSPHRPPPTRSESLTPGELRRGATRAGSQNSTYSCPHRGHRLRRGLLALQAGATTNANHASPSSVEPGASVSTPTAARQQVQNVASSSNNVLRRLLSRLRS
eukprot:jgi/Chlat1/8312/Chrsp78S07724